RSSMRCPHTSATSRWFSRATRSIRKNPCTKTLPSACACARSPPPRWAGVGTSVRAESKHLPTAMQTAFVYVTHDQAEALTLADRIVVMKDGVIQQIGTPDEVYERPRNMFVASFLGNPAINFIEGTIARGGDGPLFP